ncbi:hypothetical protein C5167_004136 [Papaver somniferum]|nr:hypothetical protein C5167_004136 [Papaver somniferum]
MPRSLPVDSLCPQKKKYYGRSGFGHVVRNFCVATSGRGGQRLLYLAFILGCIMVLMKFLRRILFDYPDVYSCYRIDKTILIYRLNTHMVACGGAISEDLVGESLMWINEVHGEQYNHGLPLADMSSIFRYSVKWPLALEAIKF